MDTNLMIVIVTGLWVAFFSWTAWVDARSKQQGCPHNCSRCTTPKAGKP